MNKRVIIIILGLLAGGLAVFFWHSEPKGDTQEKIPSGGVSTECLDKPGSPESREPLSRESLARLERSMGRALKRFAYALADKKPKGRTVRGRGVLALAVSAVGIWLDHTANENRREAWLDGGEAEAIRRENVEEEIGRLRGREKIPTNELEVGTMQMPILK